MEQVLDSRDEILDGPEISFVTAYNRISVQPVELQRHMEEEPRRYHCLPIHLTR